MSMSTGRMITAAIGGLIMVIVAFVVFPILQGAADTYYLQYINHCEMNGEVYTKAYFVGASGTIEDGDGSKDMVSDCTSTDAVTGLSETTYPTSRTGTHDIVSEHGVKIGTHGPHPAPTSTPVAGQRTVAWSSTPSAKTPHPVLVQYGTISRLVLSILPILTVTGFLGISAANLMQYARGGADSVQGGVVRVIAGLIVTIVGLYLAPTVMSFLQDAYAITSGDRFQIMGQFGTVINLVMGFVPVIYTAGLLAFFSVEGWKTYQPGSRGGMPGMG